MTHCPKVGLGQFHRGHDPSTGTVDEDSLGQDRSK